MKSDFKRMDVDQLVEEFTRIALEQYDANLVDNVSKYNRLFRRMEELEKELKYRRGDERRALIPLCDHRNVQVRLRAAIAVLALAPERARQTLEQIKELNDFPATANAFGMLRALDRGTYVPD
jgi:PP-loop superfamily ATP-utilizing enzyme